MSSQPLVRNDEEALAPMRGLLIGLPLGLLAWAVLAAVVLFVASRPDPMSWLAAYVVGPAGLLISVAAVGYLIRDWWRS